MTQVISCSDFRLNALAAELLPSHACGREPVGLSPFNPAEPGADAGWLSETEGDAGPDATSSGMLVWALNLGDAGGGRPG